MRFGRMLQTLMAGVGLLGLAGCAPPLTELRARAAEAPSCCAGLGELGYAPLQPGSSHVVGISPAGPVFDFESGKSPFAAFELSRSAEPLRLTVESYMQSTLQSPTTGDQYFFAPRLTLLDAAHRPLRAVESYTRRVRYVPVTEFAATGGVGWKIVLRTALDPTDGARYAVIHTTDALLKLGTAVPAPLAAAGTALIQHAPVGRLRVGLEQVAMLLESVLLLEHQPAYAVFTGVPRGKTQALLEALPAEKRAGVRTYAWPAFRNEAQALLDSVVVRNEYPEVGLRQGLLELLAEHPGGTFAITWNGGIAITARDHAQAEGRLKAYRADPARYERERPRDRRSDALHPLNHLEPLLGW